MLLIYRYSPDFVKSFLLKIIKPISLELRVMDSDEAMQDAMLQLFHVQKIGVRR